ncbi:uncharacterized protein N7496_003354 [Penicillium cataractarum]|uniref:Uncharacterized protein n=1 Tax=Penicillium cataractarum TaxID=2100454 RepID=A0A9W9SLT8_9EURO|nr:uncharacterized protein N7496_003354 [Penicillium cataractarum]KAJ5380926.1 hypothetical protein N7496_003354 [Penicillium cataractarum]
MTDNIRGNELSEQNLKELNKAIDAEAESHGFEQTKTDSGTASFVKERKGTFETIGEIEEEQIPKLNLERERELHVRRSYAAFCEDFTLSGSLGPKRIFHMTMGMDDRIEDTEQMESSTRDSILESRPSYGEARQKSLEPVLPHTERRSNTTEPSKNTLDEDHEDLKSQILPTTYPHPPSAIMTPAVYKEMQRAARERKRARKQKLLGPFRALFLKVQPLRTEV